MAKSTKFLIVVLGVIAFYSWVVFLGWRFTSTQLAIARSGGVFPSAEKAMLAKMGRYYAPDAEISILHAGLDLHNGKQPFVWYVIAEVHASARADGSRLGHNGCDAPGSFFVQTRDGWVYVPELAFPHVMAYWMIAFGMAGPGVSTPTTDWPPGQPSRFCQSQ